MTRTAKIVLATLCAACGGKSDPGAADTCEYDGKTYRTGDTFAATDGCNTCECEGAGSVLCSSMRCVEQPPAEDTCEYDGKTYRTGDTFLATDGCNTCACNPEGTKGVGCSTMSCDPCFACGADTVCVESFDGICTTGGIRCVKVSAACRSGACTPECEVELCGDGPYQCHNQVPCGTDLGATVNCYGP